VCSLNHQTRPIYTLLAYGNGTQLLFRPHLTRLPFLKTSFYGTKKSEPKNPKGVSPILHLGQRNESFFLDQYGRYFLLILGPAAKGQYLNLQIFVPTRALNFKKNFIYMYT
jgi:hypothetical protein